MRQHTSGVSFRVQGFFRGYSFPVSGFLFCRVTCCGTGTLSAVTEALEALSIPEVHLQVVDKGVGQVSVPAASALFLRACCRFLSRLRRECKLERNHQQHHLRLSDFCVL